MKAKFLLITLFSYAVTYAQQSELLSTTWYFSEIIHQSNNYPFIPDDEVIQISLTFSINSDTGNNQLNIHYCTSGQGDVLFEQSTINNSFRLIDTGFLTGMCEEEDNMEEEHRYLGFFDAPHLTDEYYYGDFDYEISGTPDNRILVITNELGNQVIYGSQMSSTPEFNLNKFDAMIFPNPVSANLNIKLNDNSTTGWVKIFDTNGKLLIEESSNSSINVSSLQSGFYFIFIQSEDESQEITKKFIKK